MSRDKRRSREEVPPLRPTSVLREPASRLEDVAVLVAHVAGGTAVARLAPGESVVVGRDPAAAGLVLNDDSVSRAHAELTLRDDVLLVRDLGSRNGTRVAGRAVGDWEVVPPGEPVEAGAVLIFAALPRGRSQELRLYAAGAFEARMAEEVARARATRRAFAVAVLRLPRERLTAALGAVLGAARRMDALMVYGPGEVAVLLVEADADAALALAAALVERVRPAAPGARAGVAAFPVDGTSPEELLAAAESAVPDEARSPAAVGRPDGSQVLDESEPVVASEAMRHVLDLAHRVARTDLPVLVLGETGVGKEVVARAIHRHGDRRGGPFVHVNCAALPEQLLESELFGHARGAFTDAVRERRGVFEHAGGGTIFLDEIGDASTGAQVRLLHVLESKKVVPVGTTEERPVDVRVIAATNRDLFRDAPAGAFRADLLYRLQGFTIPVPPLRHRVADIEPLAQLFMERMARREGVAPRGLGAGALAAMRSYSWPGNVRELRHLVERAMVLCDGAQILPEHLPEVVRAARDGGRAHPGPGTSAATDAGSSGATGAGTNAGTGGGLAAAEPRASTMRTALSEIERAEILRALDEAGGNRTRAAARLGISRRTLYEKMDKHGIGRG
ncbi:MAG TPA: sigma 54-interacting transcriptional regulator [Myxococcota bacterium]|jgi:DNA-binding NtrC family response regulator|nr:sigma 54-interacting transcriptional regulator [Myxococcota bacterium]